MGRVHPRAAVLVPARAAGCRQAAQRTGRGVRPLTARRYYHVGVLVADITAARERFASVTGLTFTEPAMMRFENFSDSRGLRAIDLNVCYSVEGPPYLELVQWDPEGGVFGSQHGEGLHHIGFHDDDVPARLVKLEGEQAVRIAGKRFGNRRPERLHSFLSEAADLHGVRLEIVDEQGRIALEEWLGSISR